MITLLTILLVPISIFCIYGLGCLVYEQAICWYHNTRRSILDEAKLELTKVQAELNTKIDKHIKTSDDNQRYRFQRLAGIR